MRRLLGVLAALAALGIITSQADAQSAAFGQRAAGSGALGMGGAFAAVADDASAIFANPAGIARLQGNHVLIGAAGHVQRLEFTGAPPYPGYGIKEKSPNDIHFDPHAFATFHLSDYVVGGIGMYVPFSWRTDWQRREAFTGRYVMATAEMSGLYLNPTVAMEVTPGLSAGIGLDVVFTDARFVRYEPTTIQIDARTAVADLAKMTVVMDPSLGVTFNAGLLIDWSAFHIGLSYRHGLDNSLEGDAEFDFIGTGSGDLDDGLRDRLPDAQRASLNLPFPAVATLGVAWNIADGWLAAADVELTRWSVFDVLDFEFEDTALSRVYERRYEDVVSFRGGLSVPAGERLAVRLGGLYEPTPAPTLAIGPFLPDADRFGITAGIGYAYERWRLDIHEQLVFFSETDVSDNVENFNGRYDAMAWLFGVSVGHDF